MNDPVEPLVLDLLEWIGDQRRPYREVMDAWRTSCPRLPVWETANERGYLEQVHTRGTDALVRLSARGREALASRQAKPAAATADRTP